MGRRSTEEGVMIAGEVEGAPCDSGRAELAGPVVALTVLRDLEEKFGTKGNMVLWCDSAEVVSKCRKTRLRRLPSRCCVRNVDLLLEREKLEKEYGGKWR